MRVSIVIDLDDEHVDESSGTGMTEDAHDQLLDVLGSFGTVDDGPNALAT